MKERMKMYDEYMSVRLGKVRMMRIKVWIEGKWEEDVDIRIKFIVFVEKMRERHKKRVGRNIRCDARVVMTR